MKSKEIRSVDVVVVVILKRVRQGQRERERKGEGKGERLAKKILFSCEKKWSSSSNPRGGINYTAMKKSEKMVGGKLWQGGCL